MLSGPVGASTRIPATAGERPTAGARAAAAIKWTIQGTPNPGGIGGETFTGVSCISITGCTAVGSVYDEPVAFYVAVAGVWNGTHWTDHVLANPPGIGGAGGGLSDVSCTSAAACTAVGDYSTATLTAPYKTLAEFWNGTKWAVQSTPDPAGAAGGSYLYHVSCISAAACMAVGYDEDKNNHLFALVESWDGTTWTLLGMPNAGNVSLGGVSCVSATSCTVVGSNSSGKTLAEYWNGKTWTVQSTPNPTATFAGLGGVSCKSASDCTAVGGYDTNTQGFTLAEYWNGTKWVIQHTPSPTGSGVTGGSLQAVSCFSATACVAAGSIANTTNNDSPLAESWNGTTWTLQEPPQPGNSYADSLSGVSCTATTTCTAVGSYTPTGSSYPKSLAERS